MQERHDEVHHRRMKYIIDVFGEEVETWTASEETFYAKVNVADSPTFYGWVFPFEGKIRIVGPEEILNKYRSMVKAANRTFRKKRGKTDNTSAADENDQQA